MIAHRRGRTITVAEDARRPIRLAPRVAAAQTYLSDNVFDGKRPLTAEQRTARLASLSRQGFI